MDIDDILASVDHHDASAPESTALDHQLLTRFWVAERAVSELLPWPGALMDRMMERVRRQIEKIEDLAAASSDPSSHSTTPNTNINLTLSILQTDLARTQYLIRSLLRQRLAKLTKHSMHYLLLVARTPTPASPSPSQSQSQSQSQSHPHDSIPNPTLTANPSPLSRQEAAFLHAHQTLLADHYGASFLDSFPPQLRRLDDNAGGTSMVQGPEVREAVVVRCLVEEVRVVVPPGDGVEEEMLGTSMRMGDVWVVRWEGIRDAWARGDVEVL